MLLSSMLIAMQREDGPSEYRPVCISRQYGTILTMPLVTHSPEDRILGFIEAQLESEWSDGLPIVPPTPAAVEKFIHCSGRDAADFLGEFPPRQTRVTVKDVAVNAIMAGCKPQYAPTVIAFKRALTFGKASFGERVCK